MARTEGFGKAVFVSLFLVMLSTPSHSQEERVIVIEVPEDFSTISGNNYTVVSVVFPRTGQNSDDSNGFQAKLFVDGALYGTDTKQPYTFSLNTGGLTNEWHTLSVHLLDRSGGIVSTHSIMVEVSNSPLESFEQVLHSNQSESLGYGLYTYLLMPWKMDDRASTSYARSVESMWGFFSIGSPRRLSQLPHEQLNIAYIPYQDHNGRVEKSWVSEYITNYDFDRARLLLGRLRTPRMDGPYVVSCKQPLTRVRFADQEQNCIVLDLSSVPVNSVRPMVSLYMHMADTDLLWKRTSFEKFVIEARALLARVSQPLEEDPTLVKIFIDLLVKK